MSVQLVGIEGTQVKIEIQKQWLDQSCYQLKHDAGAATELYAQMLKLSQSAAHPKAIQDNLNAAVTYFHKSSEYSILFE